MSSYQPVLDPASGSRMFYFDKQDPRVIFGDRRIVESTQMGNGRSLEVHPDVQMDFRNMPFQDGQFKLVIWDPPHLYRAGAKSYMALKYGLLDRWTWEEDLAAGFAECFRVLEPYGVLVFKWAETQIKLDRVLALTPQQPIAGSRSATGRNSHWLVFMKPPTEG